MNKVEFKDHSGKVKSSFKGSKKKALTAVGKAATELATGYMMTKYYRPIYQTGDLIRSISDNVHENSVDIGSNLDYAISVHEGTSRMRARPYLRDTVVDNKDVWKEIIGEYLSSDMR